MTRHIAIVVGTDTNMDLERLKVYFGVEVYQIDGQDAEHEIEMALLNDLVTRINLVFVGGEEAERYASVYHGVWIVDGPTAVGDVLRFLRNHPSCPVASSAAHQFPALVLKLFPGSRCRLSRPYQTTHNHRCPIHHRHQ